MYDSDEEQQARALEQRGLLAPFEERPLIAAPAEVLDRQRFCDYGRARYGTGWEPPEDLARLLRNLRLLAPDETQALHPTGLGALLFCPEPERWIGGAYVDLAVYEGAVPDVDRQRDARAISAT